MSARRRRLWPALAALAAVYLPALGAGFLAPYDPAEQRRDLPFAPPVRVHLVDAGGAWHWPPFVYRQVPEADAFDRYREDRSRRYPLRLWVEGRLFGVDEPARLALLGTDRFGRDQLSRILYGARISLFAGLLAGLLAVGIGLGVGAVAGFFGGWTDELLMRGSELFLALPWLYLLIAARAFLPLDLAPAPAFLLIVGVVGLVGWAGPARLVRGVAASARERDFVRAARGFGASDLYLLRRHVLPQTTGVVLTQLALLVPSYTLAEVSLSFLGLGVPEPVPSWGNLLASLLHVRVVSSYPWLLAPALALFLVILVYHRLADALRERV